MDAPFDTLRIDLRSELSIVGQIRGQLVLLVADGRIGPGTRLPAVRSLAAHLGVNANTARAAYARLEAEGIVETRHGVGTTVLDAGDAAMAGVPGWMTNMVGAVIAGLDPFYLDLLRGIEDQADAAGTMLVIVDGRDSPDRAEAAVRQLAARGARGLIAVSVPASPAGGTHPLPTVSVDIPDAAGDSLVFDAEAAAVDAIGHLIAHGHRRIGYVTCPVDWSNQRELYHGYRRALADAALPEDRSSSPPSTASISRRVERARASCSTRRTRPRPSSRRAACSPSVSSPRRAGACGFPMTSPSRATGTWSSRDSLIRE